MPKKATIRTTSKTSGLTMDQEITIGKLRQAFGLSPEKGRWLLNTIEGRINFDNTDYPYQAKDDNYNGVTFFTTDEYDKVEPQIISLDDERVRNDSDTFKGCFPREIGKGFREQFMIPDDFPISKLDEGLVKKPTAIDPKYSRDETGNIINWDHADDTVMDIVKKFLSRKITMRPSDYFGKRETIFNTAHKEYPIDVNQIHENIRQRPQDEKTYLYEAFLDLFRVDKIKAARLLDNMDILHIKDVDGLDLATYEAICNAIPLKISHEYKRIIKKLISERKFGDAKKLNAYYMRAQGLSYKAIANALGNTWTSKDDDANIRNKYVNAGKKLAPTYNLPDLSKWMHKDPV